MIMGYDNLEFENIQDVMLGANEKKYKQNPYSFGYIEKAIIFYNDNTSSIVEFTDASDAKDFCKTMKENGIELDKKVYKTNTKTWKVAYKAAKEENKEDSKAKNALVTAGLIVGLGGIVAASGAVGYQLANNKDKKNTTDLDLADENGFGVYGFDLSNFADMDQYANEIPDSLQKENAFNYLNILQNFNKSVNLVDDTEQLGGLTVEQLIAIDAYSNSKLYSVEDYIKTFGLYDFSNLTDNFQQGATTTGAYLATGQVDGTVLANIFKDEQVKSFYLKALEYHDKILNSENREDKKQAVKDFEKFMNDVAVDQTSEDYLDYSSHPGAAFATTVIVNSLNYNNVKLSSNLISDIVIIGDGEHQSKLDTVCDQANVKIDDVKELVSKMKETIVDNKNIKIYNANEIEKANLENRAPVLMSLQYEELDTLVSETLCDQEQVNDLIKNELTKTNQLVTVSDQEKINANAIELSRHLQDMGSNYATEKEAKLAAQLQEVGDTAVDTEKSIDITTEQAKETLYSVSPEQAEKAKEESNEKNGTLSYETEQDRKATDDKISNDLEQKVKNDTNYVNQVVAYYESHGNVSGIPAELQAAYNNLDANIFNTAKNTGIARWESKNNKTTGGEITPIEVPAGSTRDEEVVKPDEPISNPTVSEPVTPEPTPEVPSEVITPSDNNENNTIGGETTILPGFEDIDISDISTEASTSDNVAVTEADVDAYLSTAEGQQFLEMLTATETEAENVQGMVK